MVDNSLWNAPGTGRQDPYSYMWRGSLVRIGPEVGLTSAIDDGVVPCYLTVHCTGETHYSQESSYPSAEGSLLHNDPRKALVKGPNYPPVHGRPHSAANDGHP